MPQPAPGARGTRDPHEALISRQDVGQQVMHEIRPRGRGLGGRLRVEVPAPAQRRQRGPCRVALQKDPPPEGRVLVGVRAKERVDKGAQRVLQGRKFLRKAADPLAYGSSWEALLVQERQPQVLAGVRAAPQTRSHTRAWPGAGPRGRSQRPSGRYGPASCRRTRQTRRSGRSASPARRPESPCQARCASSRR